MKVYSFGSLSFLACPERFRLSPDDPRLILYCGCRLAKGLQLLDGVQTWIEVSRFL